MLDEGMKKLPNKKSQQNQVLKCLLKQGHSEDI